MISNTRFPKIAPQILWTTATISMVLVVFGFYVYAEKQVDRANNQRQISHELADQLRQSSDDLTQMVRTYVLTGDPLYKKYYQDILDIRNGKMPRPAGYDYVYWDLVLAQKLPPPVESGHGTALLDLMRQVGFSNEELGKLALAKSNSDDLTALEFKAMKLVDTSREDAESNRAEARILLFDSSYHQAKAKIMQPINEFYVLMDSRTLASVNAWVNIAFIFRLIFLIAAFGAIYILWRTYSSLRATLGGSAEEIYTQMDRIGHGDFVTDVPVPKGLEDSVLGRLSETQKELLNLETERKRADAQVRLLIQQQEALIQEQEFCRKHLMRMQL